MPDPAGRRPTIYDVAQAAGVSKSLVSLVLQGSAQVSASRRAAVERAILELGYRPSPAAATLAGSRSRTIGVLLDDYRNLWYVGLLGGMASVLGPAGFRIAVEEIGLNAHVDPNPIDGLLDLRVDGLVVATEPLPSMIGTSAGQTAGNAGGRPGRGQGVVDRVPIVIAGSRSLSLPGADVVATDDRRGGRIATEHLLGLGHRRIVHLSGSGGAAALRADGYAIAMAAAGLPELKLGTGGTTESDGYRLAGEVLDTVPELTALFAANDTMAAGAAAAARERGRSIPADLSLVGFDDSPIAGSRLLQLTTVDGRNAEVGQRAAELILKRLGVAGRGEGDRSGGWDEEAASAAVTVRTDPVLVLRASTAPA